MNDLIPTIMKQYPGAELSCRECGSDHVAAKEHSGVTANNPLGERELVIFCRSCRHVDEAVSPDEVRHTVKAWLVEEKRMYTCWFWFGEYYLDASTDKGIGEFTSGFWINEEKRLSNASDVMYWIPPGKIDHIKVETKKKRLSE